MDFIDQLRQFSERVHSLREAVKTEEATKTSLIMPFFAMLGYDVFNPQEFVPEFTADVGIKKGEKVDYAIMQSNEPVILIECKAANEELSRHDSQLFRYFGTSSSKFAILTNGVIYKFYTDLDNPNKMDDTPFLEVNLLDLKENQVPELKKFSKSVFDIDAIFDTASQLKYATEFRKIIRAQLDTPTDDFLKFFLSDVYVGLKTQSVLEKFRPILKKSLNDFVSEMMNDKIKAALGTGQENVSEATMEMNTTSVLQEAPEPKKSNITTTEEELECYFIIKNMLKDTVDLQEITYKDTESYFNILYKGNIRKWICRIILTNTQKTLLIPDENKREIKHKLGNIYDLLNFKSELMDVLKRYL